MRGAPGALVKIDCVKTPMLYLYPKRKGLAMRNSRLAVLFLLITGILSAQDYRASLFGRVTDATGGIVPGAGITAVNEGTNLPSATRSNEEGNYLIPLLEPGAYTIKVEAAGFESLLRRDVSLRTGDKLTLDFQLDVGATSDSVTVTGVAPLLDTNSANLSQVIDRRFLDLLYAFSDLRLVASPTDVGPSTPNSKRNT